jgi:tetrahydromethanopterin S-methyltransferase subunit B
MFMNKNTQPLELIVMRDGELDADYYNALKARERAEKLEHTANHVKHVLAASAAATGHFIGRQVLETYSGMYDMVTGEHTLPEIRELLAVDR